MERAGRDEQDMVGLQRPVFGRDSRPLDQRKQVALDPFSADRSAADVADRDLVDLVQEDDAVRLGVRQCDAVDVVRVDSLVGLFVGQALKRVRHLQLAALALLVAERLAHHLGIEHAHLAAHAGDVERH